MDFVDSRYFRINKLLLSLAGLWPFQTWTMKVVNLSFSLFFSATGTFLQVMHVFHHSHDLDELFETMPLTCGFFISVMKVFCLTSNLKKFKALLRLTQENWDDLKESLEMEIMIRYAESGRMFAHTYIYGLFIFSTFYSLTPLLAPVFDFILPLNETRPRRLMYSVDFIAYPEEHYYILVLSEFLSIFVCTVIAASTDCAYFLLLQHICGMQAVLCHRLADLKECNKSKLVDNNQLYGNDAFDYRVRRCIYLDTRIRMYAKLMVSAFATVLFVDIAVGALLHTSACILIVIRLGRSSEIMRHIVCMIMQSFRFLLISWIGQEIIDHSSAIPIAAYNAMWYIMPVKVQKMLKLLIARSQNHFRIIIGGIYVINLENFASVIKTSVSYCTVMISLR